jgi:hypothetical protein
MNLYQELRALNVHVWAADDPYDIMSDEGRDRWIGDMVASERYSRAISRAIKAGKLRQVMMGDPAAAVAPWGATYTRGGPNGTVVTWDPVISEKIIRIITDYRTGNFSMLELAEREGLRMMAVHRLMRTPAYYGLIRHTPVKPGAFSSPLSVRRKSPTLPGAFTGLVPAEWFAEIDAIMVRRSKGGRGVHRETSRLMVYGDRMLVCSKCGGSALAAGKQGRARRPAYICGQYYKDRTCSSRAAHMREADIHRQMTHIISGLSLSDELIERAIAQYVAIDTAAAGKAAWEVDKQARRDAVFADARARRINNIDMAYKLQAIDDERYVPPAGSTAGPAELRAAAAYMRDLGGQWRAMDAAERKVTIRALFRAIEVDLIEKRITALYPHADTAVILRGSAILTEPEPGKFVPLSLPERDLNAE